MRFVTVASISLAATGVTATSSTPAEARTDCAGSLGCIAGTQYCSLNNGQLINLHTACTGTEDDGSDEGDDDDDDDDDDDWKRAVGARADCAGSLGCIAGTQYCLYNGRLTNLHITCGDNWEGGDDGDDGDNWKRDIATRADCPGSLGCIASTQYCSYNNGSLISLHIPCGDNWEGGDDGDDGDDYWKRSEENAKRYTCPGSIGCVAGTEYCSYGDNNGWHWDNMGTPCQAGDVPIYMTDDDDSETWTGTHAHASTQTGANTQQSTTSWTTVVAAPTTSVTVITTTPSGATAASTITSSAVVTPTIVAAVSGTAQATTTSSSVSKAGAAKATAGAGLLAGIAMAAVFL